MSPSLDSGRRVPCDFPPLEGVGYLVAADGQQDVLLWDLKASAEHGFEVGFATALSKAGHLSSTGHLYTQYHVSAGQA